MNTLIIVSLIALSITAIALQIKNEKRFLNFFGILIFAGIVQLLVSSFDPESAPLLYSLVGLVSVNFIASQVKFLRKDYIRVLVPLITVVGFLMVFQGKTVNFLGADYISVNKFLVAGSILAVLGYEIGVIKLKFLKKLFDESDHEDLMTGLLLLFAGISLFLGSLASSSFGILVVAASFLSASFYNNGLTLRVLISMLILATLPYLLSLVEGESAVLIDGDVIGGLFIGGFGMYFTQKLWLSKKRSAIAIGLSYALVLGISFGFLWAGTIFYKMGGIDAMLGVFVGMALINAVLGRGYIGSSLFTLLLVGATIIPGYMVNEEQQEFENQVMITAEGGVDKEGNVIAPPEALSITEIAGNYTLLSDSSTVKFELGEEGKNKGAFKVVTGKVSLSEDPAKSSLSITLPMKHFTTFSSMRDKSMRSDEYFNVKKYPTMKFEATGFVAKSESSYELNGDFTMLGVTKKTKVTLQRIDLNGQKVLIGSGKINRTEFGMTPDASEGNVVTFSYQVVLQ
jgi:polyisoprenoid-binding protein YceI